MSELREIGAKVILVDNEKKAVVFQGEPLEIYILMKATYGIIDQLFEQKSITNNNQE